MPFNLCFSGAMKRNGISEIQEGCRRGTGSVGEGKIQLQRRWEIKLWKRRENIIFTQNLCVVGFVGAIINMHNL